VPTKEPAQNKTNVFKNDVDSITAHLSHEFDMGTALSVSWQHGQEVNLKMQWHRKNMQHK